MVQPRRNALRLWMIGTEPFTKTMTRRGETVGVCKSALSTLEALRRDTPWRGNGFPTKVFPNGSYR